MKFLQLCCVIFFTITISSEINDQLIKKIRCKNIDLQEQIKRLIKFYTCNDILSILRTSFPYHDFKFKNNTLYVEQYPYINKCILNLPLKRIIEENVIAKILKHKPVASPAFKKQLLETLNTAYKQLGYKNPKLIIKQKGKNPVNLIISSNLREYKITKLKIIGSPIKIKNLPYSPGIFPVSFMMPAILNNINYIKYQLSVANYKNIQIKFTIKKINKLKYLLCYNVSHDGVVKIDKIICDSTVPQKIKNKCEKLRQERDVSQVLMKLESLNLSYTTMDNGNNDFNIFVTYRKPIFIHQIFIGQNTSVRRQYITSYLPGDWKKLSAKEEYKKGRLIINAYNVGIRIFSRTVMASISPKTCMGSLIFRMNYFNGLPEKCQISGQFSVLMHALISELSIPLDPQTFVRFSIFRGFLDQLQNNQDINILNMFRTFHRMKCNIEIQNTFNYKNYFYIKNIQISYILRDKHLQNCIFYPEKSIYLKFNNIFEKILNFDIITLQHHLCLNLYIGYPSSAAGIKYLFSCKMPFTYAIFTASSVISYLVSVDKIEVSHDENFLIPMFLYQRIFLTNSMHYLGAQMNLECKYADDIELFNDITVQPTAIMQCNIEIFGTDNVGTTCSIGFGAYIDLKILPKFRIIIGDIFGNFIGLNPNNKFFGFEVDVSAVKQ